SDFSLAARGGSLGAVLIADQTRGFYSRLSPHYPMMFAALQKFVRKTPRGKVATYGEVARAAGYPGAARQVVWALRAAEGLPWHVAGGEMSGADKADLPVGHDFYRNRFQQSFHPALAGKSLHECRLLEFCQQVRSDAARDK